MMRLVLSFLAGAVLTVVLIIGLGTLQRRSNDSAPADRYRIIQGKIMATRPDFENHMETVLRIDNTTGQTWELLSNKWGDYWSPVTEKPLQ
jgi:hypothetical protein